MILHAFVATKSKTLPRSPNTQQQMEATQSMEAAKSKGLPTGWTASRNKGGRWTYVAPDG